MNITLKMGVKLFNISWREPINKTRKGNLFQYRKVIYHSFIQQVFTWYLVDGRHCTPDRDKNSPHMSEAYSQVGEEVME